MHLHCMIVVPNDGVIMVLQAGIKPKVEFLFSSSLNASIGINICLNNPIFSLVMPQQLYVDLIMRMGINICIRQLNTSFVSLVIHQTGKAKQKIARENNLHKKPLQPLK